MKNFAVATAAVLALSAGNANAIELYVGADYVDLDVSVFTDGTNGTQTQQRADFDSSMYRGRVGVVLNENFNVEAQFGSNAADELDGELELDTYYGVFVVPHASPLGSLNISVPIGFSVVEFEGADEDVNGVSFGINFEIPLSSFVGVVSENAAEAMPNIVLSGGFTNYVAKDEGTIRGANIGLKYQFSLGEE